MSAHGGVRILRPAEIVRAQMAATREGAEVFALPSGIASKADFFDVARTVFPLAPPLGRDVDDWNALADSVRGAVANAAAPQVVIVWPDPWLLADGDDEAGRIAVEMLSAFPGDGRAVTTILGARGV